MSIYVKICGLSTPETMDAALMAGADAVGFMFYPPSPRAVTPEQAAPLAVQSAGRAVRVGVFVNPTEQELEDLLTQVSLDVLQLHGQESPEQAAALSAAFGLPVWKALGVADKSDLAGADEYKDIAETLLFDAKPPKGEREIPPLPGGNGVPFDWQILQGFQAPYRWMLSGGLTPDNVADAVDATGALAVDVSSGVETAPGQKDSEKIAAFIRAVKQ